MEGRKKAPADTLTLGGHDSPTAHNSAAGGKEMENWMMIEETSRGEGITNEKSAFYSRVVQPKDTGGEWGCEK